MSLEASKVTSISSDEGTNTPEYHGSKRHFVTGPVREATDSDRCDNQRVCHLEIFSSKSKSNIRCDFIGVRDSWETYVFVNE